MPKFLTRQEAYNLIEREMPEEVLAFSARPVDFYTTSDDDAFAQIVSSAYTNLSRIYDNYFPQTALEKLEDHEIANFGEVDDSGATVEQRRDRILSKIRSRKGITVQDIKDIVYTIIGSDKNVQIIEKGCDSGAWILGKSKLSNNTYLGITSISGISIPYDFDACADGAAASLGLTEEELANLQIQAYSYEVRIIGYTATALELYKMDKELTRFEPARSDHKIISPFVLPAIKAPWKLARSKLTSRTYLG